MQCNAAPRIGLARPVLSTVRCQHINRIRQTGCAQAVPTQVRRYSSPLDSSSAPLRQAAQLKGRVGRSSVVVAAGKPHHVGSPIAHKDQRYAIVVARFNELVTRLLLAGAIDAFERHGLPAENIEVAWVPGSYELPVVASAMARSGKFDAVVCIGTVVRGATTHYEAVAGGATNGVLDVSRSTGVPTIFGVLTTETMEQAQDRAGGKTGNKGAEAAITAIEMANVLRDLRGKGLAAEAWGTA
mmetsp:Transcript_5910/g.16889  ORF Transcript_5910/g.16889 Transcript_5910/m.16889 type:complete len:242 (+) Transcript_5910:146-871(+)